MLRIVVPLRSRATNLVFEIDDHRKSYQLCVPLPTNFPDELVGTTSLGIDTTNYYKWQPLSGTVSFDSKLIALSSRGTQLFYEYDYSNDCWSLGGKIVSVNQDSLMYMVPLRSGLIAVPGLQVSSKTPLFGARSITSPHVCLIEQDMHDCQSIILCNFTHEVDT